MSTPSHHQLLVAQLKVHWRNAGGPLSLTDWLGQCWPTIDPLWNRGVPWTWMAPRLMAVYNNPEGELAEPLAPLSRSKTRTVSELYWRAAKRAGRATPGELAISRRSPETQQAQAAATGASTAVPATPPAPSPRGADPPGSRRDRIRRNVHVANSLGHSE